MPIIIELPPDSSDDHVENGQTLKKPALPPPGKLKQWMHLNHVLNCKTTSCKTFKMICEHLLQQCKIDETGLILIPTDYKVANYSDAILTIVCSNSETCKECLILLDHLSCHKRYCECNNYREICYHQLHLKHAVEIFPVSGNSQALSSQCSIATKEKIESLGKYHYEAIRVLKGLKSETPQVGISSNKSVKSLVNEIPSKVENPTVAAVGNIDEQQGVYLKDDNIPKVLRGTKSSKDSYAKTKNVVDSESIVNSSAYAVTPFQHKRSEHCLDVTNTSRNHDGLFSDESLIHCTDDDSDEYGYIGVHSDLTISFGYSTNVSAGHHLNFDSDSSLDTELQTVYSKSNMKEISHTLSNNSCPILISDTTPDSSDIGGSSDDSESDSEFGTNLEYCRKRSSSLEPIAAPSYRKKNKFSKVISDASKRFTSRSSYNVEASYIPTRNRRKSYSGVRNVSVFSDENFINTGSDSSSNDEYHPLFRQNCSTKSFGNFKKRKHQQPELSDECLIDYDIGYSVNSKDCGNAQNILGTSESSSDDTDDMFLVNITDKTTTTTDCSHNWTHNGHGFETRLSVSSTPSVLGQDNTFGSSLQDHSANTSLGTSYTRCEGYTSDCWYCRIEDSISKSDISFFPELDNSMSKSESIIESSIPKLDTDSQTKIPKKQKKKGFTKRRRFTINKTNKKRDQKQPLQISQISNLLNEEDSNVRKAEAVPASSSNQRKVPNKLNKPHSTSTKSSSLSDFNYSYIRNVLSQENAQSGGGNKTSEKRKPQPKKETPRKKKKKMKLYDTSTWIESSNYYQLSHMNLEN